LQEQERVLARVAAGMPEAHAAWKEAEDSFRERFEELVQALEKVSTRPAPRPPRRRLSLSLVLPCSVPRSQSQGKIAELKGQVVVLQTNLADSSDNAREMIQTWVHESVDVMGDKIALIEVRMRAMRPSCCSARDHFFGYVCASRSRSRRRRTA